MLALNITNVEKLIFYDKNLRRQLADLENFFQKWEVLIQRGQRVKQVLLDFLSAISQRHMETLENYFQDQIQVDNLDYHIVKSFQFPIPGAEDSLCGMTGYDNFAITRDGCHLYISFWR